MVFECNLPKKVPGFYDVTIYSKLQATVDKVYARTDKLNKALAKSGMSFEVFHKMAKAIFDISSERFDKMTPTQLAKTAVALYDGSPVAPFMEWPNAIVLYDTAFVANEDWEALRHFGIGGSDSSVVMGLSHFNTLEGLWFDKIGAPVLQEEPGRQSIFDRGHYLEDRVIDTFCRMTGAVRIPETRMFQCVDYPNTTANIDGILLMPNGDLAIFEAKTTIDEFNTVSKWFNDHVPAYYVTQVHQYIRTLNDPRIKGGYIGCIPTKDVTVADTYMGSEVSKDFYHSFIERDDAREKEILEAESRFWNDYVVAGVKPAPSKDAELDKIVADKFKPNPVNTPGAPKKELPYEESADLLARLMDAEEEVTATKKLLDQQTNLRDTLRQEVIEQMGAAKEAEFKDRNGNTVFITKNTPIFKKGVDVKKLVEFHEDIYQLVRKDTSYTKFSVKEIVK